MEDHRGDDGRGEVEAADAEGVDAGLGDGPFTYLLSAPTSALLTVVEYE